MKQIDYESRVDPPEPVRDLEYQFGCFPALGAGALVVAIFFTEAAGALNPLGGVSRPKPVPCILAALLVLCGWYTTLIVLRRRSGLLFGLLLALAMLVATAACVRLLYLVMF